MTPEPTTLHYDLHGQPVTHDVSPLPLTLTFHPDLGLLDVPYDPEPDDDGEPGPTHFATRLRNHYRQHGRLTARDHLWLRYAASNRLYNLTHQDWLPNLGVEGVRAHAHALADAGAPLAYGVHLLPPKRARRLHQLPYLQHHYHPDKLRWDDARARHAPARLTSYVFDLVWPQNGLDMGTRILGHVTSLAGFAPTVLRTLQREAMPDGGKGATPGA